MSTLEDAARRVQRGDASAFREIVEATSARLVRLSARMMGSVAEAEDVVQDAYVKAYRALALGQFDARSRVETWLHRIVVNASLDAKRKRARAREDAIDSSRGQECLLSGLHVLSVVVSLGLAGRSRRVRWRGHRCGTPRKSSVQDREL